MKKGWLIFALLLSCLLPQFAYAETTPAMRQSTQDSNAYGVRALQQLRQSRSDLFQKAQGVLVVGVVIGSQADAAGMRICDVSKEVLGDVIVSYAGLPINTPESFVTAVTRLSVINAAVNMVVIRNKAKVVVQLKSGAVGVQLLAASSLPSESTLDGGTEAAAVPPGEPGPGAGTEAAAVDSKPQIFVQLGQASDSVAVSPDGRLALTGSGNTVKLWEIASGREIRTLTGNVGAVNSVVFSPDGRYALSGSADGVWRQWEIATGKTIRAIKAHGLFARVAISPDGRQLLSGGDSNVILWDLATGQKIRTMNDPPGHSGTVTSVAFSPDGRQALSTASYASAGTWGNKMHYVLKLWDVATGQLLRTMDEHTSYVNSAVFSPDGRQALSGSWDKTLKLWDLATGKEIRNMDGHLNAVNSVAFSPDGKKALSCGFGVDGVKLWDLASGRAIRALNGGYAQAATFSPDGRQALTVSVEAMRLWDIASGALIRRFRGNLPGLVAPTAFSPDGGRVVSGGVVATAIWDVTTGRRTGRAPEGGDSGLSSIAFSPDGRQILSGHYDKSLRLIDAGTGKLIRSFTGHSGPVNSVTFSRDGSRALSSGGVYKGALGINYDSIRLWDVATGETIRTLAGRHGDAQVNFVDLSPDGKQALSAASTTEGVKLWDLASGKVIHTFQGFSWAAVFSPDGRYALSTAAGGLKLLDLGTGREVRSFKGHSNMVRSLAFSPDGKLALSGSRDNTMKLWDVATGKEIRTFVGHSGEVSSVSFSPDGRLALSGSVDSSARIWEVATGKELIQMIDFDDGEWLSITPEGYFSASSPKAAENINVRMGMNVYGIDQFFDVFYRPDIVDAALAGKDISRMVTLTIDEALKNPPPVIETVEAPGPGAAETVKVAYRIRSNGGGIGDVRVFHNGKLVKSDGVARKMPDSLLGKKASQLTGEVLVSQMRGLSIIAVKDTSLKSALMSAPKPDLYESAVVIEPIAGENDISVVAFNAQNSIQSVASTVSFTSKKPPVAPRLYILAVGIDQYKDKSSNLKFAVKDSGDIAARWKAQAANIYGEQNIFAETVSNAQASREGILGKINRIAARVKPTDHFVLFVASHGVLLGDQYYMVTSDYDGALQPSQLISANEIVDFSKRIRALSQLYILDTCHAGGMGGVVSGLYDARVSVLAKKMGLHVFASASSAQEALDGFEGNGLFTHTLLSGLNNNKQADTNSDKQISLMELGSYSKGQTREIAARLQHKQDPLIIDFGQDSQVYKLQ